MNPDEYLRETFKAAKRDNQVRQHVGLSVVAIACVSDNGPPAELCRQGFTTQALGRTEEAHPVHQCPGALKCRHPCPHEYGCAAARPDMCRTMPSKPRPLPCFTVRGPSPPAGCQGQVRGAAAAGGQRAGGRRGGGAAGGGGVQVRRGRACECVHMVNACVSGA